MHSQIKTYHFTVFTVNTGSIEVEAENEEDARNKVCLEDLEFDECPSFADEDIQLEYYTNDKGEEIYE